MDIPTPPVVPRAAATVLLLRDGPQGIEVFMAVRHQGSSFVTIDYTPPDQRPPPPRRHLCN